MSRQKIPGWPAVDSVNGTPSLCGGDETGWLVNAITGSPVWEHGRNALFVVFDEGNGAKGTDSSL